MLKQRIITALILAALVLALIFFAPGWSFAGAMFFMALVGAWEWSALTDRSDRSSRLALVALFGALAIAGGWLQYRLTYPTGLLLYMVLALAWWL